MTCYNISAEDKDNRSVVVDYVSDDYTTVEDHPTEKMDGMGICGPVFKAYDFDKDNKVDAFYEGDKSLLIFNEKYRHQAQATPYVKYGEGKTRVILSADIKDKTKAQALFNLGNDSGKKLQSEFAKKMNSDAIEVGSPYPYSPHDIIFTDSQNSRYTVLFDQNYSGGVSGDDAKYPINGATLFSTPREGYSFFCYKFGANAIGMNQDRAQRLRKEQYSSQR